MTDKFIKEVVSGHYLKMHSRHCVVFILDHLRTFCHVNSKFEQLTGYRESDLIGKKMDALFSNTFVNAYNQFLQKNVQSYQPWTSIAGLRCNDNTFIHLPIEIVPIIDEDQTCKVFVCRTTGTIVTDSSHSGVEEYHRLAKIAEAINEPVWISDNNEKWLLVNSAAKDFFDLPEKSEGSTIVDLSMKSLSLNAAMQKIASGDSEAWRKATLQLTEERYLSATGEYVDFEVRRMPVFETDGSPAFIFTFCCDITERKKIEADVLRARKTLEQALRLARVGVWEVDMETNELIWSDVAKEIVQVKPDYVPVLEKAIDFYTAGESRSSIVEAVNNAIHSGHGFELESEIITASGERKWIHTVGQPTTVDGRCTKMVGYFYDVTEKIGLRKKHRQSEKRFEYIIEKSNDMVLLLDNQGRITYCSPSVSRMLEYTPEEVIGRSYSEFVYIDDLPNARDRIYELTKNPRLSFPFFVSRLKNRSGVPVLVEGSVSNLLHDENLNAIVANIRNVTDLMKTQWSLRQKTQRLERIASIFSHQVRGPVATILGLANIFNHASPHDPVNEEVISKIVIPVSQLDNIISEIVRITYELELESKSGVDVTSEADLDSKLRRLIP